MPILVKAKRRSAMAVILAHLIQTTSVLPTDASTLERSISALDKAITAREISSGNWERWLPAFAFWVAVGVAIEIVAIIREYLENRAAWRRATIRLPEKPHVPKLIWELMGAILVTTGVGLEFWGGAAVAQINGDLRSMNAQLRHVSAQLVVLLTNEASDAGKSAKTARHEADVAKKSASTAGRKVEEVKRETNKLVAQLKEEQNNLLQLEKDAAPRFIWLIPTVKGTNIDVLRNFPLTTVIIKSIPDWEARRAAGNIAAILHKAGWNIKKNSAIEGDLPEGVTVEKYQPPPTAQHLENWWGQTNTADAASELMNWLEANDWQVHPDWADLGELQPGEILILVGIKPVSYFQPWPLEHPKRNGAPNKRADEIRKEIRQLQVLPNPPR
jgi:hypothetical protein